MTLRDEIAALGDHEKRPKPTVAELEAILAQETDEKIEMLPNGEVRVGGPYVLLDDVLAIFDRYTLEAIDRYKRKPSEDRPARKELYDAAPYSHTLGARGIIEAMDVLTAAIREART
jgi:hypothetical protein